MPIVTIVLTFFLLIFGEITPKTLALKQPERYAIISHRLLKYLMVIFQPVIYVFNGFNVLINRIFKIKEDISNNRVVLMN